MTKKTDKRYAKKSIKNPGNWVITEQEPVYENEHDKSNDNEQANLNVHTESNHQNRITTIRGADATDNNGYVNTMKCKVKALNPLRRLNCVNNANQGADANPNVTLHNNGLTAWMDANLNSDFEHDQQAVNYALRNADNSRYYDIDDIPSRRPHKKKNDIEVTAKKLVHNDITTYICRSTGVGLHEEISNQELPPNRRPANVQASGREPPVNDSQQCTDARQQEAQTTNTRRRPQSVVIDC